MRLPKDLGFKLYLVAFGIVALIDLESICLPTGTVSIYYNTLVLLHPPSLTWYLLALLDKLIGVVTFAVLLSRTFPRRTFSLDFVRGIFLVRILSTLLGHNYEMLAVKSALVTHNLILALLTLGVWAAFIYPSFKEHYGYAFRDPADTPGR